MKAVVYKEKGVLALEERPRPALILDTDAIVRVTLTTICSSDIHIKHGAVPRAVPGTILGHEFVGVVEEIGASVKKVKKGDRVAVNVETFCGSCFYCRQGYVNNCTDPLGGWALGCRIDGGQSEYVRIPYADNGLTKIPDAVSDEAALFTGDILSTGYWAAKLGGLRPGDKTVVLGAGPTGLCTMMCARLYSPGKVIAIDIEASRRELALKEGFADVALDPSQMSQEELEKAVAEACGSAGADVVFEVAGGQDTFQTAWKIARPNAVVMIVAMYEEDQRLPLPQMYGKNLTFKTGGVDGCDCDRIMELLETGKLDTRSLITHRTDLAHIMEAYDVFENKKDGVIKYAIHV